MSKALEGMCYCVKHQGNHSHYTEHNCIGCTQQKRIAQLEAELTACKKDAELLNSLRMMCGHVENGSDMPVSISQDDATRDWCLTRGTFMTQRSRTWAAPSFTGVIALASKELETD